MRLFLFKRSMALFLTIALILALGITTSIAQQTMKVAGEMALTQTNQNKVEVGDVENHAMNLTQYEGTNASVGEQEMMDGAQVVNLSFGDLVKGNGTHQGYVKLTSGDDTTFAGWEGIVTAVVSEEGTPHITVKGTFSWIKGTGGFENIQGNGTYSGEFTSETTLKVEWEGEYSIGE